jgi:hypothetical protein
VKKILDDFSKTENRLEFIQERIHLLYEKGISGKDIIKYIELSEQEKSKLEFYYYKIKKNIRNDKMIMMALFYRIR